jgi:hypothetical protein
VKAFFVALLISFASQAWGQTSCTPGGMGNGYELLDQGRQWNSWSKLDRLIYLEGFVDGQSNTFLILSQDLPVDRQKPLTQRTFTFYKKAALADVMTSLYSDPANTYVALTSMVYIARDKLGGKDTGASLRDARQKDCSFVKAD